MNYNTKGKCKVKRVMQWVFLFPQISRWISFALELVCVNVCVEMMDSDGLGYISTSSPESLRMHLSLDQDKAVT